MTKPTHSDPRKPVDVLDGTLLPVRRACQTLTARRPWLRAVVDRDQGVEPGSEEEVEQPVRRIVDGHLGATLDGKQPLQRLYRRRVDERELGGIDHEPVDAILLRG